MRPGERPAAAGLGHPVGGDHVRRPERQLPLLHPAAALQPEGPAPGPHRGHEGGAEGGQRHLHQPRPAAGAGGEPGAGGAGHPVPEPPGGQPNGVLRGVRPRARVPPVLGEAHLPLGQRAAHVPLLRLLPAPAQGLPGVRRRAQLHRGGHPEGPGGAPGALPPNPHPAHGHGHRHRLPVPRGHSGGVSEEERAHSGGDPDGGQGSGL